MFGSGDVATRHISLNASRVVHLFSLDDIFLCINALLAMTYCTEISNKVRKIRHIYQFVIMLVEKSEKSGTATRFTCHVCIVVCTYLKSRHIHISHAVVFALSSFVPKQHFTLRIKGNFV